MCAYATPSPWQAPPQRLMHFCLSAVSRQQAMSGPHSASTMKLGQDVSLLHITMLIRLFCIYRVAEVGVSVASLIEAGLINKQGPHSACCRKGATSWTSIRQHAEAGV